MVILGIDSTSKDIAFSLIDTSLMEILKSQKYSLIKNTFGNKKINSNQKCYIAKECIEDIIEKYLFYEYDKELSKIVIETTIYQGDILFNQVKNGYYEIIGSLQSTRYYSMYNGEKILPKEWQTQLGFPTEVTKEEKKSLTSYQVKKLKEQRAIEWVKENFGEEVDSDIADATMIAYGWYLKNKEKL